MIVNCTPRIASPPRPPQGQAWPAPCARVLPLCQSGQPRRSGTGPGPWHQRRSRPAPPPSCCDGRHISERSRARSSQERAVHARVEVLVSQGRRRCQAAGGNARRPLQPELSRPTARQRRAGSSSAGGAGQDERGSDLVLFGASCWRPLSSWWRLGVSDGRRWARDATANGKESELTKSRPSAAGRRGVRRSERERGARRGGERCRRGSGGGGRGVRDEVPVTPQARRSASCSGHPAPWRRPAVCQAGAVWMMTFSVARGSGKSPRYGSAGLRPALRVQHAEGGELKEETGRVCCRRGRR